jgi:predicted acylesterase/phospholipase RssA
MYATAALRSAAHLTRYPALNKETPPPEPPPVLDAAAPPPPPKQRLKLGLALAGGGFRASFFHLGVLRRLAELDVLRRVEVISTVSGGSIIGALYVLLLREKRLAKPGRLAQADYVRLVGDLEAAMRQGIRRNLRNRLFLNPLALLRIALGPDSLGNRMARLYERHVFREVVARLRAHGGLRDERSWLARALRPGVFPLTQIRPVPAGCTVEGAVGELPGGIDGYNEEEEQRDDGCAVPHLVLNATSMNSGGRFWFSSSEVGDWYLGYARLSEAARLEALKKVREAFAGRRPGDLEAGLQALADAGVACSREEALLTLWVEQEEAAARAERAGDAPTRVDGAGWGPWAGALSAACVEALVTAELGLLRFAQEPAWYLRVGMRRAEKVTGGMTEGQHRRVFRTALYNLDGRLAYDLARRAGRLDEGRAPETGLEDAVMDLVLGVYELRSAAALAPDIGADLRGLTLGEAVGASACFPPVFSPFTMEGFYDDAHVGRLGLTDGGVFDNVGMTALQDDRCAVMIVSDTGGVFEPAPRSGSDRARMLARLLLIFQDNLGELQRSFLKDRRSFNRDLERIENPARPATGPSTPDLEAMRDDVRRIREARPLAGLAYFHIESATRSPRSPTRGTRWPTATCAATSRRSPGNGARGYRGTWRRSTPGPRRASCRRGRNLMGRGRTSSSASRRSSAWAASGSSARSSCSATRRPGPAGA